jgi:hypothetical protein
MTESWLRFLPKKLPEGEIKFKRVREQAATEREKAHR